MEENFQIKFNSGSKCNGMFIYFGVKHAALSKDEMLPGTTRKIIKCCCRPNFMKLFTHSIELGLKKIVPDRHKESLYNLSDFG
jgi:hypothetical protein